MPEPLSPKRITEIRERADSATPGPWGVGNTTEIALDVEQTSPGCFSYTVKLASVVEDDDRQDDVYYLKGADQPRVVASAEDDALFIAHSRQDVEELLAEVDRLKAEAERLSKVMGSAFDDLVNGRPSDAEQTLREALFIPAAGQAVGT